VLCTLLGCLLVGGCATAKPAPATARELAEVQTFPYYRVYWVGPRFGSYPLAGADGRTSYNAGVGDSLYYGDCVEGKSSALGSSGCELPLQVTTVIYSPHMNTGFGSQRNILLRGVPAVVYDGGDSIELYSGRLAIDALSDTHAEALHAVSLLRPVNAPGSATGSLPAPVYCPTLSGPQSAQVQNAMHRLPHRACQHAAAALRAHIALFGKP
jgi:hypothetical protein